MDEEIKTEEVKQEAAEVPQETKVEVKEVIQKTVKETAKEGLTSKIDRLLENQNQLISQKKVKRWKLPFSGKLSKLSLKKNYVTVMYIKDNKSVDFIKVPIDQETITLDGLPRASSADYVLSYKGKPLIIQPSWSIAPFSPTENISDTEKAQLSAKARKLVFTKMKNDIIVPKKLGFGGFGWIILLLVGCGVGYYLWKGGKLF